MCIVITVAMVMLLRESGPYGINIYGVCCCHCAMVMVLRDFGPYSVFITMCIHYFTFSRYSQRVIYWYVTSNNFIGENW
jgi:hypothetical protein